jgi:hypothetical protein
VVVAGRLLVHGGFDGTRHLDDLWSLDLSTWHWTKVNAKVSAATLHLALDQGQCKGERSVQALIHPAPPAIDNGREDQGLIGVD